MVTRWLQVERRTAKERWPETDVLLLSHGGQPEEMTEGATAAAAADDDDNDCVTDNLQSQVAVTVCLSSEWRAWSTAVSTLSVT